MFLFVRPAFISLLNITFVVTENDSHVLKYIIIIITIVIMIIICSPALGGPWTPQTNVASDLYPGHPPANFYNPVSLRLPIPLQSVFTSVGHVLVDLQALPTISF